MSRPRQDNVYRTVVCDSSLWTHYKPRPGDIVVTTPPKCGTTWMQTICALIVFRRVDFPEPLNIFSRWIDSVFEPPEEVFGHLDRQTHRRIVKTHTPLNCLPYYEAVQYLVCGRDPRDAFLSFQDHRRNTTPEAMQALLRRAGLEGTVMPDDVNVLFQLWMSHGDYPGSKDGFPTGSVLNHLASYWVHRKEPNIHFFHYADLMADAGREMRRAAETLSEPVPEKLWPKLIDAASLGEMRAHARHLAPAAGFSGKHWKSEEGFFHSARMGAWRDALSADNQALYLAKSREHYPADLLAWAEQGASACNPKAV